MKLRTCGGGPFDLFGLVEETSWVGENVCNLSERVVLHVERSGKVGLCRFFLNFLVFFLCGGGFWVSRY